jgi:hypothetical protein
MNREIDWRQYEDLVSQIPPSGFPGLPSGAGTVGQFLQSQGAGNPAIWSDIADMILDTNNASGGAFGRLRVADLETIFDSKQLFDNQPLFWDDQEVSGGSTTSTHSVDRASTTIGVGATTAGRRVRQTFRRFNYQPGKSQLVLLTGILDRSGGGAGITRGFGLYDDKNGLFLRDNEGTYELVRRSYVSGSAVDEAVIQPNWNIDPFDGTGISGITLDFTKAHILVIDFEWLGVGRVRMGFNIDGVTYYAHQFVHANLLDAVYMSTPNLPLRYEIENDGTGAASTLEHICSSVNSEGGLNKVGPTFYITTDDTVVEVGTTSEWQAVLGVRLKSSCIGQTVRILDISLLEDTGNEELEWALYLNPSIDTPPAVSWADEPGTCVQKAVFAEDNLVSGGTKIAGGYFFAPGGGGYVAITINSSLNLGSAIDGTVDEIILAVQGVGGANNADVHGAMNIQELS